MVMPPQPAFPIGNHGDACRAADAYATPQSRGTACPSIPSPPSAHLSCSWGCLQGGSVCKLGLCRPTCHPGPHPHTHTQYPVSRRHIWVRMVLRVWGEDGAERERAAAVGVGQRDQEESCDRWRAGHLHAREKLQPPPAGPRNQMSGITDTGQLPDGLLCHFSQLEAQAL